MAAATTPGLTPQEAVFLAENEMIDIVPRQRLESLQLLGCTTPKLNPPQRASVPLWLALLLRRQQRANVIPPPWLSLDSLMKILDHETELAQEHERDKQAHASLIATSTQDASRPAPAIAFSKSTPLPPPVYPSHSLSSLPISPPFAISSTSNAPVGVLPYHWLEIAQSLLDGASEDLEDADNVRRLVRDLREARAAKMRDVVGALEGGRQVVLNGVSAMEVVEHKAFLTGVVDGLRRIGTSRETNRREREEEEQRTGRRRRDLDDDDDSDDEMGL